ncbi:unnamed protein product [Boreogadus saida]
MKVTPLLQGDTQGSGIVLEDKEVGVVGEKGSNSSSKYSVVCWQRGAAPNLRLLPDAQEPKSSSRETGVLTGEVEKASD